MHRGVSVWYDAGMEPPNTQPLPIFRYFVQFPDAPGQWQEVSKKEYTVLYECMSLSNKPDHRAEGVRLVKMPRDLYRAFCPLPASLLFYGLPFENPGP